jgi:hypothetical protein
MKLNKKFFLVFVLVLTVTLIYAQQKANGEFQILGQQVYENNGDKATWGADVGFRGTSISLGSIKKGILNITLPAITETEGEDKVYFGMVIGFAVGPGASLSLANIEKKDYIHFKFQQSTKRWVFISRNTGKEDALENFIKAGYKWYAGQEPPFF